MDEYAGRGDLKPGKRTFRDGRPLTVWIFSDRSTWDEFHGNVTFDPTSPSSGGGYFSSTTGLSYLYDLGDDDDGDRSSLLEAGTAQLVHWFMRQKRDWGTPVVPVDFFSIGLGEYFAGVTVDRAGTLTFDAVHRHQLQFLQGMRESSDSDGRKFPIFPLKDLVGFEGVGSVMKAGALSRMPAPLHVFFAQSWALVVFLNEFEKHKYQAQFVQLLGDMLVRPRFDADSGDRSYASERFKLRMGLRSTEDWDALQTEFTQWYLGDLLKRPAAPAASSGK
jgi:hypothetical protein